MTSWRYTDFSFRPIGTDWPSERPRLADHEQRISPFSASWGTTLAELELELRQLEAERVVLQIDVDDRDIRLDGKPRATARQKSSAVILSFESCFGPQRYACDEYRYWKDNVRAIALSLKALRAVDRYGVSKRGEQYTGWKALAPAGGLESVAEARDWIASEGGIASVLRRYHPDTAENFDPDKWARALRAKELVE